MASPEAWLSGAIEDAADCPAYPLKAPEGKLPPYVLYARTATSRERALDGTVGAPVGTFAVEMVADGYLASKQLADLVRAALMDFSGVSDGATIDEVDLAEESDGDPVFLDGRDVPTYIAQQVYSIRWQE